MFGKPAQRRRKNRSFQPLVRESLESRQLLTGTGSNYAQLHRDIVIRADIYGGASSKPRILAASYGFEGIQGIPGLLTENQIDLAVAAGAGVVGELVGLDPAAPLRNVTSGASQIGIQTSGFSDSTVTQTFMDAMPIEFSHPLLPSTVLPRNFRVRLNTGEAVTPLYVAQNPNYDLNERQTIVAFGYFGNRLPSEDPASVHPVLFEVVASSTPLKLITPKGLVDGTGLSQTSSNPYDPFNGPTLVGAKLSPLSLAGDYPPAGFAASVGNHGVECYGAGRDLYRLRLGTHGPICNPGGPGTVPLPQYRYTQPSPGQTMTVEFALHNTATVSWADQHLAAYDSADQVAVAFRLRNSATGEWQLTGSSADAASMVDSGGWVMAGVPFAANANDSYVANVAQLRNAARDDSVYTANPRQIQAFERAGYTNMGTVFTAYDKPLRGLDPAWLMISRTGKHAVTASPQEKSGWMRQGWQPVGIAFYTVRFPNADSPQMA